MHLIWVLAFAVGRFSFISRFYPSSFRPRWRVGTPLETGRLQQKHQRTSHHLGAVCRGCRSLMLFFLVAVALTALSRSFQAVRLEEAQVSALASSSDQVLYTLRGAAWLVFFFLPSLPYHTLRLGVLRSPAPLPSNRTWNASRARRMSQDGFCLQEVSHFF